MHDLEFRAQPLLDLSQECKVKIILIKNIYVYKFEYRYLVNLQTLKLFGNN